MTKFGRYELLEELGRGGFGTVYKAEDQVLDRIVALKVLHPALMIDPTFLDRFKQEARTAARLDHPNLVQVFDFGESEGNFFITMAYMSGGSLRDLLSREGNLSPERAIQIFQQTAAGLTYAHNKNVIHRDLKPGNILLDENGTARVSDLGFAKVLTNPSSMTMSVSGGLIGTPAYMAPELWLDQKATKQTDQYSLACILVEMLTGTPLFDGESTPGIMTKHFQPLKLPEQLDDSWRPGLEKALQQTPQDRWDRIEEFTFSLLKAKNSEPTKDYEQKAESEISPSALYEVEKKSSKEHNINENELSLDSIHDDALSVTATNVDKETGQDQRKPFINKQNPEIKQSHDSTGKQYYINHAGPTDLSDNNQDTHMLPLEPFDGDPSVWGNYASNPMQEQEFGYRGKNSNSDNYKKDNNIGLQAIYVVAILIIVMALILMIISSMQ